MYRALCERAVRQTFGNDVKLSSFNIMTDGYRNLTAKVACSAYSAPMFFKAEKPFSYPKTQKYQIAREQAGLLLCAQHNIPAPKLIAAGNEPSPWLLETFMPGKPLSHFALTTNDKEQIKKEFETIFHKLCQIQSSCYGDTFDGGFLGRHKEWKEALAAMTQLIFEDGEAINLWGGQASLVQSALQKALKQINDSSPAVFYHCDLFSANVMGLPDEHELIHIHSIIDFGMSMFAPLQYVRNMTRRYCDLLQPASSEEEPFAYQDAYQILRIEPLLLMKLFQYSDTECAVDKHIQACIHYLDKD